MRRPLVTVLTAVHNGDRYLAETIANIQAQDFMDWEYIIVDDASTDNTPGLIESAAKLDARIVGMRRDVAGGPYTAANDGVRASRGKYIVRTDADDLSPADRITKELRFLERNPRYRACVSWWQPFDERGLLPGQIKAIPSPGAFKWYLLLRGQSIHSTLCMERQAFEDIGFYRDLPLSQDYRLWCELTRRGWLGVIPEPLSYVRFHENRSTNRRADLQRTLAQDVIRDHWKELTGSTVSGEEMETLWAVGYSMTCPVRKGLEILDRWDALWRSDGALAPADRAELARLSALRRWKFLRTNLRRQPVASLAGAVHFTLRRPAAWRTAAV